MSYIRISNIKIGSKDYMDFYKNPKYKLFGINDTTSTLVPFYKELLREVIVGAADQKFRDRALSTIETQQIKDIFIAKLEETLPKREIDSDSLPHQRLEYDGKVYELNLSLFSPNNRRIWDFHQIIEIATQCLQEGKPMYLSME